ncbi:MAG: hypothetical protein ACYCVM_04935 [Acidiferrobacter sp.]
MRARYRIFVAGLVTMAALAGCARKPHPGVLTIGKTYTAAVSMAIMTFKVVARRGHGWYVVQLLGHNLEPFTAARPALINARQMSVLQGKGAS